MQILKISRDKSPNSRGTHKMATRIVFCRRMQTYVAFARRQNDFSPVTLLRCSSTAEDVANSVVHEMKTQRTGRKDDEDNFTPFLIAGKGHRKLSFERKFQKRPENPVKEEKFQMTSDLSMDIDWTKAWPTAQTFNWFSVPLPLRQGVIRNELENQGIVPGKTANTELMKIPNFLHLTPPHVWKHCQALKKFCTPWPEGLESKEDCRLHFPVEVITSDYCFAGPSVRDPRARVVTIKVKVSDLDLDEHAFDKLLKLVGDRYNKDTDELTLKTDRCPTKQQNQDYALYLFSALYEESQRTLPWEDDMEADDFRKYNWKMTKSKDTTINILKAMGEMDENSAYHNMEEGEILEKEEVKGYEKAVSMLHDDGEDTETLSNYKQSVLQMLKLKH